MTRSRLLVLLGVVIVVLLGAAAGAWWYLYGANAVSAAELVPGDTVAFATIPNATVIATGYETSQLKKLVDSPNAKPLIDTILTTIGQKNVDLLKAFFPNLSGQSFIAITHLDIDKPEQTGFVAGMKPKPGLGDFNAFVDKLKATWPDALKEGKTGTGNVAGVDYQWIQGPGAPDKICVAQFQGWIVTTWGEASLKDWIERFQKKSTTPSLAQNADYQKTIAHLGKDPMTLVYVNYHTFAQIFQKQFAKTNPAMGDYFAKKIGALGGAGMATRFENGEIVDRFSFLIPRQAQIDNGMTAAPCPFETLKFTGPDTRFYWATSLNWQTYWKNLEEQMNMQMQAMPVAARMDIANSMQTWAKGLGLDLHKNIIDPLGSEMSLQLEWTADATYPSVGLFVKLDKPADFKPTITAIVEDVRKTYTNSASIKEISFNDQNFATLKFFQPIPISPTITEDGPYLGVFLTENQAVNSYQRDEKTGVANHADFIRQIGDKRNGASQIVYLESPQLLDRTYKTALPFVSMAAMFNKDLAAMLKGKDLPPDLAWLAPMGAWSFVASPNDEGVTGYSVSGVGNQGIFLAASVGGAIGAAQMMGLGPKMNPAASNPMAPSAPLGSPPASTPTSDLLDASTNAAPSTSTAPEPMQETPSTPPATDTTTNAAPSSAAEPTPATNATPDATPPSPDQAK